MNDIAFKLNGIKFNYRVASIIRYDNKILLHKNINETFYALPGGRVKLEEDSKNAIAREFYEEMNAEIKIKNMVSVVENFFDYDKKIYHEIMLIYECDFVNYNFYNTEIIKGIEENGELQFVWKNIDDVDKLDIRPTDIKKILRGGEKEISHIICKNKLI